MRSPATPGWGLPAVVVCGSPPLLAGACRLQWGVSWVGVSLVVCVCGVWLRAVAVLCCVLRVCGDRVVGGVVWWCGVGVSSACAGVLGCVCVVCWWSVVCCPRLFWLGLAAGVCVGVVGVWCGSPATPGGGTCVLCPATPGWGPPLCGGGSSLATPGWGGLVAGPRHSWLGLAAGCGGWSLATPGRGSCAMFPATAGWGPPVLVVGARSPLCNGITQSDYFPSVALRLLFIFNVVVSHLNIHDYAKPITESLLNLILLFCEKT